MASACFCWAEASIGPLVILNIKPREAPATAVVSSRVRTIAGRVDALLPILLCVFLVLSFLNSRFFAKAFRLYVFVDERCKGIHYENGKRHSLGVGSVNADEYRNDADACSIEQHAPFGHGRAGIVGRHKKGAQQYPAGQQVKEGTGVGLRVA